MRKCPTLFAAVVLTAAACAGHAPSGAAPTAAGWSTDSVAALGAARAVVAALDSLQWERFEAALAADVTVFMPLSEFPERLDGRDTVAAAFHAFFEAVRASRAARGITRPPYLGLQPRDWAAQPLAPGAVLVTFQLGPHGQAPGRRTLVLRRARGGDRWELVHLHGSSALQRALAPSPPGTPPNESLQLTWRAGPRQAHRAP